MRGSIRHLENTAGGVCILLLMSSVAMAAPVPITTSSLTPAAGSRGDKVVLSSYSASPQYPICPAVGCDGSIIAGITNPSGTLTVHDVNLWCVDSQLDVSPGEMFTASVVSLATPAALFDNGSEVRYGSVGQLGNPTWINSLGPNYTTALSRYALTATLVLQYQSQPGDDGGHDIANPLDNAHNQALMNAAWEITENTSFPTVLMGTPDISTGVPAGYSNWIAWAEANVSSTNLADWAIVSGSYQPQSVNPSTAILVSTPEVQTFLVEVVPEPGFYGVLGVGFAAIAIALRRRKRAA